ncbi:SGNH/GDSL hydrolase family protein [Paenibacillus zeisoli]|uniref:SGNH/GDSL hydrolase family protein n=1 Tax=Paenibacillus zeisoli TaxID=2496267 RepID=A0A3S1B711_9BACL|nr:SGNH/GDSL hydrolase family protein [Paenibacillus zeisoli]RUT29567.1 SGNH/GDSL hydrolase family protein [Paenibacillus zeisoli]
MTQIWNHRRRLERTLQRIGEGTLTLGFIGGSITDARPRHNWPEPVIAWFSEVFPQVTLKVENAAIGATGSDLAVFRAERDLIDRGADLVFVEYAVNDYGEPQEKRGRTREGLIRQLLAGEGRDVVLTYTYMQEMYEAMMNGEVPDSIAELEQLGVHYGLGSIWMGRYALDEVQKGRMRWQEWLPDGLHPTQRGSLSYAHSVIKFLERELVERQAEPARDEPGAELRAEPETESGYGSGSDLRAKPEFELGTQPESESGLNYGSDNGLNNGSTPGSSTWNRPDPLNPNNWERVEHVPFENMKWQGPWVIRRWVNLEWIDRVLETAAVGAKLSFEFEGRGLALGFDFGKASSEFKYRLDGGEWKISSRDRPSWVGDEGWFRLLVIADDLTEGPHEIEIEVIHGSAESCTGTDFRLAFAGVIK